jgi:5-methylcytosine-specific restriction endonuclease McrA
MKKPCRVCGLEKALTEFHVNCKSPDGRLGICKLCHKLANRQYRKDHPDIIAAQQRRDYLKRREAINAYQREWRKRTDSWRIANKRWEENNRERYLLNSRVKQARRRAMKLNAPGIASDEQIQSRIDYWGGLCWMCGRPGTEIDHVIALISGGSNWPANLRPACKSCNSRKHKRSWREFAPCNLEIYD